MIYPRPLARVSYLICTDKSIARLPIGSGDVLVTFGQILADGMVDLNDNNPRYKVSADGKNVLAIGADGLEIPHATFGTISQVRNGHEELWLLDATADTTPSKDKLLERWWDHPASRLSILARTFVNPRP